MGRAKDVDDAEWDALDPAGDESLYDGQAVESIPYDHSQFEGGENGND